MLKVLPCLRKGVNLWEKAIIWSISRIRLLGQGIGNREIQNEIIREKALSSSDISTCHDSKFRINLR